MASLAIVGGGAFPARVAHKDLNGNPVSNIPNLGTEPMVLCVAWSGVKSVDRLKAALDDIERVLGDRRAYPDLN